MYRLVIISKSIIWWSQVSKLSTTFWDMFLCSCARYFACFYFKTSSNIDPATILQGFDNNRISTISSIAIIVLIRWVGVVWCCMMFYDDVWCCMTLYDVIWCCMMLYEVVWCHMMFYDVVLCCMMLYDVI